MKKNKKKRTVFSRLKLHVRKRMVAGLFLILPLGISLLILRFLYNITAGLFIPAFEKQFGNSPPAVIAVLSILVIILGTYLMGMIGDLVIGRRIIRLTENILLQIPFLRTIYLSAKSIVNTFSSTKGSSFKSAVLVEFPKANAFSIGFITGETTDTRGGEYYKVFIPSSPNPTSGFLQILPVELVKKTNLSVEDAIKLIISGGTIGPKKLFL